MLIDVSHHNVDAGPINWDSVDSSADGVYIKITEGSGYVDPTWVGNWSGARGAGLPTGAYHFASLGNAVAEANHFADQYLSKTWQLRPVLDIETNGATAAWLKSFRAQFRKRAGTQPFRVYTGYSFLIGALAPSGWIDQDTDIWAARYRSTLGWDHPQLVLWQSTSVAHVPGLLGSVDVDQYQHGWTPAKDSQEEDVAVTPQDIADFWGYQNAKAGDKVDMHQMLVNAATAATATQGTVATLSAAVATLTKAVAAEHNLTLADIQAMFDAEMAKTVNVHVDVTAPNGDSA